MRPPSIAKGRVVCGLPSRSVVCRAGRQAFRSETQEDRMMIVLDKNETSPDQEHENQDSEKQHKPEKEKPIGTDYKLVFDS